MLIQTTPPCYVLWMRGILESYLDWPYIKFLHPLRSRISAETFVQLVRFGHTGVRFLHSVIRLLSGVSVQYPQTQTEVGESQMCNVSEDFDKVLVHL